MNKIYLEISKLYGAFVKMCFGFSKNREDINDAVQELMLYFLQMNPDNLKAIFEKDGKDGLKRYGYVVLKRALTSKKSPFYYKYKKYYTNLYGVNLQTNSTIRDNYYKSIYNLPEEIEPNFKQIKLEIIDKELDKLDYWYDKKVFELYYYEGNTLDSLAKKTGISRNSLFSTIDKVRELIKDELNEE